MAKFEYAPAPESRSVVDLRPSYGLFVDGDFVDGTGAAFKTVNPATEEVLAEVAEASAADVDHCGQSAAHAGRATESDRDLGPACRSDAKICRHVPGRDDRPLEIGWQYEMVASRADRAEWSTIGIQEHRRHCDPAVAVHDRKLQCDPSFLDMARDLVGAQLARCDGDAVIEDAECEDGLLVRRMKCTIDQADDCGIAACGGQRPWRGATAATLSFRRREQPP